MSRRESKDRVIAFRLSPKLADKLKTVSERNRIIAIRSGNQFARKVIIDFLESRLTYPNSSDRDQNPLIPTNVG